MKRISYLLFVIFIISCSKEVTNRNPYLQELGFRFDINLSLPLYSPLTNPGSPVYIPNQTVGTRGAFVMNTGFDQFRVFEASCPNHAPNECSTMIIEGQSAICA